MSTFKKYGCEFKNSVHPLQVEMFMIRQGEQFCRLRKTNLAFHYEQFRKIVWPNLDSHRWHELCRNEIIKNKVTVLLGPGSSGKTHEAAWVYLVEYWCWPEETCVLVSSTDMRGLRKRVWGEITMLWQEGVDQFDFLKGTLLDSAIAITTDNLDDTDFSQRRIRDMRKGIFGVPCIQGGKFVGLAKFVGIKQKRMRLIADEACFPKGSLVNTPSGPRPIESLRVGDAILNCLGESRIKRTSCVTRKTLLSLKTRNGREIICTPSHPFLTSFGWKCACDLRQGMYMVGVYESMQILQTPDSEQKLLHEALRREVHANKSCPTKTVLYSRASREDTAGENQNAQGTPGICCGLSSENSGTSTNGQSGISEQNDFNAQTYWTQTNHPGRQWDRSDQSGETFEKAGPRTFFECCRENWQKARLWLSTTLQTRFRHSRVETGRGGRRELAPDDCKTISRCQKSEPLGGDWLDSVAVLEQKDIERLGGGSGGIEVYNLEIEGHPSYAIAGLLVHNSFMGESFLSSFANLNKNADFRAIILGNPNDVMDPLGRAAEPEEGWTEGYMEPSKTTVWNTRFMHGRCVNLIGTDSPNFDYPENEPTRYPYLISREKIADTLSFFPKDSLEYYSQCIGAMKIGTMARRVLTRQMCQENHALETAVWDGQTTKVYFVDASYGGDACVAGMGEFGKDVITGNVVLAFGEPKVIPILANVGIEPEYQIAQYVKDDCEAEGIPAANMGHDATGRGGLGTALAKVWSADTHPVEFGGSPSDRPVALDLYVFDEVTKQKRLKLCREHYDRKVTELWFQVRLTTEAQLVRSLPAEAMNDLCTRKWDRIKGEKFYAVEPKSGTDTKPGMKQRTGKSPDHGDWAAGILEMARRRGFVIPKMAADAKSSTKNSSPDWLEALKIKTMKAITSKQLQNA